MALLPNNYYILAICPEVVIISVTDNVKPHSGKGKLVVLSYTHFPVILAVQESDLLEPGVHAVGIAAAVAVRELRRAEDREDVELVLVVDGDVLPRLGHSGEVRQSANHAARR